MLCEVLVQHRLILLLHRLILLGLLRKAVIALSGGAQESGCDHLAMIAIDIVFAEAIVVAGVQVSTAAATRRSSASASSSRRSESARRCALLRARAAAAAS